MDFLLLLLSFEVKIHSPGPARSIEIGFSSNYGKVIHIFIEVSTSKITTIIRP